MAKESKTGAVESPAEVVFDYIKNPNFRVTHVDGCIGSVTPTGNIHMSVFAERPALPRQIRFAVNEDGSLGNEVPNSRDTRDGIVREMDFDMVMSPETAQSIAKWLLEKVEESNIKK